MPLGVNVPPFSFFAASPLYSTVWYTETSYVVFSRCPDSVRLGKGESSNYSVEVNPFPKG